MISNDQAFAQAAQNAHPGQSNGQFEMRESAIERTKSRLDKYRKTAEKKTIDENAFLEAKLRQDMQESVFLFLKFSSEFFIPDFFFYNLNNSNSIHEKHFSRKLKSIWQK